MDSDWSPLCLRHSSACARVCVFAPGFVTSTQREKLSQLSSSAPHFFSLATIEEVSEARKWATLAAGGHTLFQTVMLSSSSNDQVGEIAEGGEVVEPAETDAPPSKWRAGKFNQVQAVH